MDGTPATRGSVSTACRSARATALNVASRMWWVFRPWCSTTCRLNPPAEDAARHDAGEKTVLTQTGKWTGSDLVKLLLAHPATAERIATRLCRLFFGENAVPPEAARALAGGLREHELDVGWAAGVVLKSRRFFADANLGNRVRGPAEFTVGEAVLFRSELSSAGSRYTPLERLQLGAGQVHHPI